jgi:hypothetical protein
MLPNPVEVTDDEPQSYFCLLPQLAKFVLPPMPPSSLLAQDPISLLQALSQSFANVVLNFRSQYSFISTPSICVPFGAVGLTFGANG